MKRIISKSNAPLALIAAAALSLWACSEQGYHFTKQSTPAADVAPLRNVVNGVRLFRDEEMYSLLLPTSAVPGGLELADEYLLPNREVAKFFPDPASALQAMVDGGRMQGAAADYQLGPRAPASPVAVALSSTTAWYRTVDGAQAVVRDGSLGAVIARVGLHATEMKSERVGDECRAFLGYSANDGRPVIAYLIVFRRDNVVGTLMVAMPSEKDDGGKLAFRLARRQAGDLTLARRPPDATPVPPGAQPSPTPTSTRR